MIWARQPHEALAIKRRGGAYTSSAKENCAQHISQPLALEVLQPLLANLVVKQRLVCMSRPGSGSGQGIAYNLALDGVAHLLEKLVRHVACRCSRWELLALRRLCVSWVFCTYGRMYVCMKVVDCWLHKASRV